MLTQKKRKLKICRTCGKIAPSMLALKGSILSFPIRINSCNQWSAVKEENSSIYMLS
jgi:hypothetical protein